MNTQTKNPPTGETAATYSAAYSANAKRRVMRQSSRQLAESDRGSYLELLAVAARALQSARHTIETNLVEIALKTGGEK
jgi:hypothetical protein